MSAKPFSGGTLTDRAPIVAGTDHTSCHLHSVTMAFISVNERIHMPKQPNPKRNKMFPREVKLEECPKCKHNTVSPDENPKFCLRAECGWQEEKEDGKPVGIIINGRDFTVPRGELSYDQLCDLTRRDYRVWTMTYSHWKRRGELVRGQSVMVEQGMVFNIAETVMT